MALADSHTDLGRHEDARRLNEEALAGLPPGHPLTLHAMERLARNYSALGREQDCMTMLEQALAGSERILPRDHPDTLGRMTLLGYGRARAGRPVDALKLYKEAITVREQVAAARPDDLRNRVDLGYLHHVVGDALVALGRAEESLPAFARAIDQQRAVLSRGPSARARKYLRNSYGARAVALGRLGRHAEAAADWDQAVELSDGRERSQVRAGRANSWVEAGRVAEAVAEVADLTKADGWDADGWYDFACVYAVASGKLPDRRDECAARAVELLRKAIDAGYRDRAHLDPDLAPLRGRPDFRALVESLPYTAPPPRPVNRP